MDIGKMIKELRTKKNMTLRTLAQKANLSIGFLSQLERGMTTVAVDSLQNIAAALDVDTSYFLSIPKGDSVDKIIRSFEQTISFSEVDKYIHYYLSTDLSHHRLFPEIILLVPEPDHEAMSSVFAHKGEEFVYVLEGILTVNYQRSIYQMYPGDSFLFKSSIPHNWYNTTNQMTKILVVHYPNAFQQDHIAEKKIEVDN